MRDEPMKTIESDSKTIMDHNRDNVNSSTNKKIDLDQATIPTISNDSLIQVPINVVFQKDLIVNPIKFRKIGFQSTTYGQTNNNTEKVSCEICSKQFTQKRNLHRHLKECHSRGVLFGCTVCDSSFNRRENLVRHMEQVHKK